MPVTETALLAVAADAAAKAGATAATSALFKSATDRAERVLRGPTKGIVVRALASLQSYAPFLQETHDRVSTFKTFADPTKPVSLLDHFVETRFEVERGKPTINQAGIIKKLSRPSRIVISATAGYGKSMVMRYFALALFENPIGKIPIFLELRNLNRVSSPSILSFLHSSYKRVSDVQIEAFKQGLSGGAFVILLDGFDELNHDIRPIIENEILEIAREYPQCSLIISGRPDDRFKAWRSFSIYKVAPMAQDQVVELINKLEYERGVRKRFIAKVNSGLYQSHQSFMSTPLLAILMLLTFEQNANIPDKMHLFYGEAFKTLFHKHDALKEQYDRARKSSLMVDDFEKVFSVFCLKTYIQEKTEFSSSEIASSIRDAIKYESFDVNSTDFLFDVEEAVCLIMKEGASYFFVHRSFQEYFTAVFLANCAEHVRDSFIEKVSTRYWDNVLPMLFDMASSQIEPTWVTRKTREYLSEVGFSSGQQTPLQARFNGISFYRNGDALHWNGITPGSHNRFISTMIRFYPQLQFDSRIEFSELEIWSKKNWDFLFEQHGGRKLQSGVEILEVPVASMPHDVISKSNLEKFANFEHAKIAEVESGLDKQQTERNMFLSELFS
jgi:hypothetical protein